MDVLQRNARAESYRVQGVLSDLEVKAEALGEALVETTQEGTTTGEDDTIGDDVGVELGRRSLERARIALSILPIELSRHSAISR